MLLLKNMTYEQLYKLTEDLSDLKELRLLKEELEEKTDTYNMENLQYTVKDHRRDCRILNFINRVSLPG